MCNWFYLLVPRFPLWLKTNPNVKSLRKGGTAATSRIPKLGSISSRPKGISFQKPLNISENSNVEYIFSSHVGGCQRVAASQGQ